MIVTAGVFALAGLLSLSIVAATAQAKNTRVTVANFAWSQNPTVARGESVTWDWPGPDLQHSVSSNSANTKGWDSDPDRSIPFHQFGDTFKVTFSEPGTYKFICKLHPSVKGVVTVEDRPGQPDSDPGPPPPINFDLEPPYLDEWFFTRDGSTPAPAVIGPNGKGIGFYFAASDRGTADVDYYRVVTRYRWKMRRNRAGKRSRVRVKVARFRKYVGYTEWQTHVGLNVVRFAARSKTFPSPRPGRYIALFRTTDEEVNTSAPIRLTFRIKAGKRAARR